MNAAARGIPPECETVLRSLWEYLDGRVRSEQLAAIEEHLERCDGCRAHARFEGRLVDAISGLRRNHSDPVRLRAAVLSLLRSAGFGDAGGA